MYQLRRIAPTAHSKRQLAIKTAAEPTALDTPTRQVHGYDSAREAVQCSWSPQGLLSVDYQLMLACCPQSVQLTTLQDSVVLRIRLMPLM